MTGARCGGRGILLIGFLLHVVPFFSVSVIAGMRVADASTGTTRSDAPSLMVPDLGIPPKQGLDTGYWKDAARLTLANDFTYRRPAPETTVVRVAQDPDGLNLSFNARQAEPVTAVSVTDSSGVSTEDYVGVYLFPDRTQGIAYWFICNPNGARYQTSSENSAYSPQWEAVASKSADGYSATMHIPFRIMRGAHSRRWNAQFVRYIAATGSVFVWAYSSNARKVDDPAFAGVLDGMLAHATSSARGARPAARIQGYALSESTSKANGGSTSRVGLDMAIPISQTASFVATLHPDYSNVEVDQQTIAPSTFARQYAEVRPFFTQASSYFNQTTICNNCAVSLYTPEIPTFAQGYAIEGTASRLTFAGFDAINSDRDDSAQTLNYIYKEKDLHYSLDLQNVDVNVVGAHDITTTLNLGFVDEQSHIFGYANLGQDRGTFVTDPSLGNYVEAGTGYIDATTTAIANIQSIGAQYDPFDGYVAQTDISGYELYFQKTLNFKNNSLVRSILFDTTYNRYSNRFNQLAQTDGIAQVFITLKGQFMVQGYGGGQGARTFDGEFLPFDANGFLLGYDFGTTTPTQVSYTGGKYYHGDLDAWQYLTTVPLAKKLHLQLEADEDQYLTAYARETTTRQWLERASIDWQLTRQASLDIGVRRIIGYNIPNAYQPVIYGASCGINSYTPGCLVNAGNVSVAFHILTPKNELYFVYGNANSLTTEPALFIKWIRYVGAQKGT